MLGHLLVVQSGGKIRDSSKLAVPELHLKVLFPFKQVHVCSVDTRVWMETPL